MGCLYNREVGVDKWIVFGVRSTYQTGGGWTCVKYNIIAEKNQYKGIGLHGFYYTVREEEESGGDLIGIRRVSLF